MPNHLANEKAKDQPDTTMCYMRQSHFRQRRKREPSGKLQCCCIRKRERSLLVLLLLYFILFLVVAANIGFLFLKQRRIVASSIRWEGYSHTFVSLDSLT